MNEEEWVEDESDLITIDVAVMATVSNEQLSSALESALGQETDIADFEVFGARTLENGSVVILGSVRVESGMAAMEWQRYLNEGHVRITIELPVFDAYALKFSDS